MKIKYSQVFWGILFITLGLIYILNQFFEINLSFSVVKNYWPVFLIALGLFYFSLPNIIKIFISGFCGALLGIFIFSLINFDNTQISNVDINDKTSINNDKNEFYNQFLNDDTSSKIYKLNLDFAAGNIIINDKTNNLVDIFSSNSNYLFNLENYDSVNKIINISSNSNINFKDKVFDRKGRILLNSSKFWSIDANLGAASADFDFSNNIISNLNINSGASTIKIKLAKITDSANINIDCGASKIVIFIPYNIFCKINSETALSKVKTDNFKLISKNAYETDNLDSNFKKLFINIEGGVSKFIINRY